MAAMTTIMRSSTRTTDGDGKREQDDSRCNDEGESRGEDGGDLHDDGDIEDGNEGTTMANTMATEATMAKKMARMPRALMIMVMAATTTMATAIPTTTVRRRSWLPANANAHWQARPLWNFPSTSC